MNNALFSSLQTYDPRTVDLSYISETCRRIPKDGHIDINVAEELATIFLQCADYITDEICKASIYSSYCEADRREVKASAIDNRMQSDGTNKGVAATVAIQLFGNDAAYKDAHRKQGDGEAFLDWLRTKYKNLMAAHVLCKDILKIHFDSLSKGGHRQTANPHSIDDEKDKESTAELPQTNSGITGKEDW